VVAEAGIHTLLWPTSNGVLVALQPDPEPIIRIRVWQRTESIPCTALFLSSGPREYADAVSEIDRHCPPRSSWWGPALMAWVALMREEFVRFGGGARLLLHTLSGEGNAASVITAVAQALVSAYNVHIAPRELAITCAEGLHHLDSRRFELIGTLTTVCAPANEVLVVQPHQALIGGSVHLPPGCAIWTIRVGDEPRQPPFRLRSALTTLERLVVEIFTTVDHSRREEGAILASLRLTDFIRYLRDRLPDHMSAITGAMSDQMSPSALTNFVLAEQQRSRIILALLRAAASRLQREEDVRLIGELLTQSHWEQATLGLTDPHADALARRLVAPTVLGVRQPVAATQTTLLVFGLIDAEADIQRIATAYQEEICLPVSVAGGSLAGIRQG
jgi:galactokinase